MGQHCSDHCCTSDCVFDTECPLGRTCDERGRCVPTSTEPGDTGCGCDVLYRPGSSQGGSGASSGGFLFLLALAFLRRNFRVF